MRDNHCVIIIIGNKVNGCRLIREMGQFLTTAKAINDAFINGKRANKI